ncbi:hypothetical protein JRQ81_001953 [Phrynocephalus forsythii]|uniref:non-specific serine/threonine protein kinase n=1 Tax=Phrynocephalus forsythii TaxID=171643 RepID=A0A9Q0YEI5_9SAUR|nr:hypothetical protein JRQ81_001953 [Phrynocephalus forsythii]
MGHALCICSKGTITINNKRYLSIHRLGEGNILENKVGIEDFCPSLTPPPSMDWAAQRCTISYRAPELFNVERECVIDERTDIWKGDSVALAVQNNLTVPENTRYSPALKRLLCSAMVANPQERPYIADIIRQLEEIQPPPSGQDTTRI